jgi:cell division protein FtsB
MNDVMNDEGNELGVPSLLVAYKQRCQLLMDELDDAWLDVRQTRRNVAKLVRMNASLSDELAALRREHEKLRWTLSDVYRQQGLEAGRKLNAHANAHRHPSVK